MSSVQEFCIFNTVYLNTKTGKNKSLQLPGGFCKQYQLFYFFTVPAFSVLIEASTSPFGISDEE